MHQYTLYPNEGDRLNLKDYVLGNSILEKKTQGQKLYQLLLDIKVREGDDL